MDVLHNHNIALRKPDARNTSYISIYIRLNIRQSYSCVRGEDDGPFWRDGWMDSRGVLRDLHIQFIHLTTGSVCVCVGVCEIPDFFYAYYSLKFSENRC